MSLIASRLLLLFSLVFSGPLVFSQSGDSSFNQLVTVYHKYSGDQDPIYNGREYQRLTYYISKGIPYYKTDAFSPGQILYDGIVNDNVPLLYDLITDELITKDMSGQHLVALVPEKVTWFILQGDRFIYLSSPDKTISTGYYKVIYDKKTRLLVKQIKYITDKVKAGEALQKEVQEKSNYYLKYNDRYYTANSFKSVQTIFRKEDRMKEYLRTNKNKFNKLNIESMLIEVAGYYDQLTR